MFDIEYKGGNSVVIAGKQSALIVDPKLSVLGQKDIQPKGRVEVLTESRFGTDLSDAKVVIDGPGEYEVGDFSLRGVAASRHIDTPDQEKMATIYRIESGDVSIALIGNIAPGLTDEQLEALGVIDVLIVPVGGGGYTLDAADAISIVSAIEPKVVIPIHYADPALTYEVPQDSLDVFRSKLGAPAEVVSKYRLKSAAALPVSLTMVELTRS